MEPRLIEYLGTAATPLMIDHLRKHGAAARAGMEKVDRCIAEVEKSNDGPQFATAFADFMSALNALEELARHAMQSLEFFEWSTKTGIKGMGAYEIFRAKFPEVGRFVAACGEGRTVQVVKANQAIPFALGDDNGESHEQSDR